MNIQINGLTINGTHVEMVDFVELWQTRSVSLAALAAKFIDVPNWKDDPATRPLTAAEAKQAGCTAGSAPSTPAVVKSVIKTLPKVKHTDAPPADAPVTKVPAGVSGKRGGRPSPTGATSHIRYAIFNGKTEQQALIKAVGGNQKNMHARISTLIARGQIEEVNAANSTPGHRSFRITELGRTFIDHDREVLKALGKLP